MPNILHIPFPVRLDGMANCDELWIHDTGRISTESGAILNCEGDVFIFGEVRATRGASIRIESRTGNIAVFGSIRGGDGLDGAQPGEHGTPGGRVELVALKGEVLITGHVQSGRGGNGEAAHNFPSVSDARGGNGMDGGEIRVHAGTITLRAGRLLTGMGGRGGNASADSWTSEQWLNWVSEHWIAGGPMDPPQDPPLPPIVITEAEGALSLVDATSGRGGNGGDIVLVLADTGSFGHCANGSVLRAGGGGASGDAEAVRGTSAQARVSDPGRGGGIRFEIGAGAGVWTRAGTEEPGDGSRAGGATAGGHLRAEAHIAAGGKGGRVVQALAAGGGARGNGGGVGQGRAASNGCERIEGPHAGGATGPGPGISLHCP